LTDSRVNTQIIIKENTQLNETEGTNLSEEEDITFLCIQNGEDDDESRSDKHREEQQPNKGTSDEGNREQFGPEMDSEDTFLSVSVQLVTMDSNRQDRDDGQLLLAQAEMTADSWVCNDSATLDSDKEEKIHFSEDIHDLNQF